MNKARLFGGALALVALLLAGGVAWSLGGSVPGNVEIEVPDGASARGIGQLLADKELIRSPRLFALVARFRGSAADLKAGRYVIPGDASWGQMLDVLERGAVETVSFTIPEGFTVRQIADVLAEVTAGDRDSIRAMMTDSAMVAELQVPGPGLEGYLFPETYRVAEGLEPLDLVRILVAAYGDYWTEERRRRLAETGLTERELVTLASIVEKEARVVDEMPTIAGVYVNRLEIGMLLQADPTVQYALGAPKARLLFADIDAVADNPYNTYTHSGLPPGPIASPGAAALDAALQPADVPFLYFVARPDGSHQFSRTLREHNNARIASRREAEARRAAAEAAAREDTASGE